MPVSPPIDGYALALEEARRALDEQERAVAELRSRAGTLISAATIATSFLGAPFVADRQLAAAGTIAIAAFVLLSLATLVLLSPRWAFEFSLAPEFVIATFAEPIASKAPPPSRLRREMAMHMGASSALNRNRISRMGAIFQIACVLLTTEIVAWVVAIFTSL